MLLEMGKHYTQGLYWSLLLKINLNCIDKQQQIGEKSKVQSHALFPMHAFCRYACIHLIDLHACNLHASMQVCKLMPAA